MNKKLIIILSATILVSAAVAIIAVRWLMPAALETRLVYKIDVDAAIHDKLLLLAGDLEDDLKKLRIKTRTGQDKSGDLIVTSDSAASTEAIKGHLSKRYKQTFAVSALDQRRLKLTITSDLQGETRAYVIRQAIQVVRQRVTAFTSQAAVFLRGHELYVELPELPPDKLALIKKLMQRSGTLEFRIADDASPLFAEVAKGIQPISKIAVKRDQYDGKQLGTVAYTALTSKDLSALTAFIAQLPAAQRPPLSREILYGEASSGENERFYEAYLVHRRAALTGELINEAEVQWDERTGRPEVSLTFSKRGSELFAKITEDNVGRRLAIILDGRVNSAPVIQSRIDGGRARITLGGFKDPLALQQEAKDLVAVLRAGSLPTRLILQKERALKSL